VVCKQCGQEDTLQFEEELPKGYALCCCGECGASVRITIKDANKLGVCSDAL